MAVPRVWGGFVPVSSPPARGAQSACCHPASVSSLLSPSPGRWEPSRTATSSLPPSGTSRVPVPVCLGWLPAPSAPRLPGGCRGGPENTPTPLHTPLPKDRALFNEKQQMGIAGNRSLPGQGRLMMSLNIVSVSVSHSCPFCRAAGPSLPRPVPWEEPSGRRGRSGR